MVAIENQEKKIDPPRTANSEPVFIEIPASVAIPSRTRMLINALRRNAARNSRAASVIAKGLNDFLMR